MKKVILTTVACVSMLAGCKTIGFMTVDGFLDRGSSRYVLLKKDAHLLDGPYKIIERVSAEKLLAEKDNVKFEIYLRGCKEIGGLRSVHVQHSYYEDMGLYLLKDCSISLSSNRIRAVVYRPANRVYVGMPNGFDNLSYVMPQLLHISYGNLKVDHSDTNYPMYKVFCDAEYLAKKHKKGYWADQKE
jgi:hypothetical protein